MICTIKNIFKISLKLRKILCHHHPSLLHVQSFSCFMLRHLKSRRQFSTLAGSWRSEDSRWSYENAPTTAVFSPGEAPDTPHRQVAAEHHLLRDCGPGIQSSKRVHPSRLSRWGSPGTHTVLEATIPSVKKGTISGQTSCCWREKRLYRI